MTRKQKNYHFLRVNQFSSDEANKYKSYSFRKLEKIAVVNNEYEYHIFREKIIRDKKINEILKEKNYE